MIKLNNYFFLSSTTKVSYFATVIFLENFGQLTLTFILTLPKSNHFSLAEMYNALI